eukprot:scaffold2281_cov125-Isochrysis_galbana.AAC.2
MHLMRAREVLETMLDSLRLYSLAASCQGTGTGALAGVRALPLPLPTTHTPILYPLPSSPEQVRCRQIFINRSRAAYGLRARHLLGAFALPAEPTHALQSGLLHLKPQASQCPQWFGLLGLASKKETGGR